MTEHEAPPEHCEVCGVELSKARAKLEGLCEQCEADELDYLCMERDERD